MRDPERIDKILNWLNVLWHEYPDFRLTQLIKFCATESGWVNNDLFHLDDKQLSQGIVARMEEARIREAARKSAER